MQTEQTLEQQIREYEANMPPEILNLIKSFDWKKELRMVVNQNQLMIDIGSDLEQSVYLMILGVLQAKDLFERLVEVHEMPADKAQKVIEEIEAQIFAPLHQKLVELDDEEVAVTPPSAPVAASYASSPVPPLATFVSVTPAPADKTTRDDILAEIEKEPEPLIKINKPVEPVSVTQPVVDVFKPAISLDVENDIGIARPFSLPLAKEVEISEPIITVDSVAKGVQIDPIATGLGQPTSMQAQAPVISAPTKSYVADPYREPIE